jgi:signal transduction histidine kinase
MVLLSGSVFLETVGQFMKLKRLFSSLRFRITLAVTITLVVILGTTTIWRYWRHSEMDIEEARHQAAIASEIIRASFWHSMLTNDRADLQSSIDSISRQSGMRGIYLVDATGTAKIYPIGMATNLLPGQSDLTVSATTSDAAVPDSSARIYTDARGEQILQYTNVIANEPACYGCHSGAQPILGAFVTDFALTETTYQITSDLQGSITTGLASILAVVIAINLLLSRFVLDKLDQFTPVLRRFGEGDLSQRLSPRGDDEIGRLAVRFNQMADGLETRANENAQLYGELEQKEAARAMLLHKVIVAQEEEHKFLARELHDDFAQSLTALSVTVQSAIQIIPTDMQVVHDRLERVQALTQETLSETSRWIQALRPRMLDDLGLVPALRTYAEARFEGTATRVQIETKNLTQRLPPEVEITLFRVMQEALSNIAKHAHAYRVEVSIERYDDGAVVAHVQDDGIGFIPAKYLQTQEGLRGMGLLGMRERTVLLGGTLTIESTPGRGTRLRIQVPWKESAE